MSFGTFLNQTLTSTRLTRVRDGAGGWTETQLPHLSATPCASRPAGPKEETIAAQLQATVSHVVYVYAGVDLRRDDAVTLSGGLRGRVIAVLEPGGRGVHYEVLVEAVQRGR